MTSKKKEQEIKKIPPSHIQKKNEKYPTKSTSPKKGKTLVVVKETLVRRSSRRNQQPSTGIPHPKPDINFEHPNPYE